MTIKIRKSVFETNSSSSHSLTLAKTELVAQPFTSAILREGVVRLEVGSYGWKWHRFYRPIEKLEYLLTQLTNGLVPEGVPEVVTRELRENDGRLDMLCRVVEDHTGCKVLLMASEGGIDHQSASSEKGNGLELFNNEETLRQFLFMADNYIQTGNDNDAAPWRISTDRGPELTYASFIKEPPATYRSVTLIRREVYSEDGFTTSKGAVLSELFHPDLYKKVLRMGIVEHAHWLCGGSSNPHRSGNVKGMAAASLTSYRRERLKLSPEFDAESTWDRTMDYGKDVVTLTVLLPEKMARELASLARTPRLLVDLKSAEADLPFWEKRCALKRADDHDRSMLAKTQESVRKLTARAAKKGLL